MSVTKRKLFPQAYTLINELEREQHKSWNTDFDFEEVINNLKGYDTDEFWKYLKENIDVDFFIDSVKKELDLCKNNKGCNFWDFMRGRLDKEFVTEVLTDYLELDKKEKMINDLEDYTNEGLGVELDLEE